MKRQGRKNTVKHNHEFLEVCLWSTRTFDFVLYVIYATLFFASVIYILRFWHPNVVKVKFCLYVVVFMDERSLSFHRNGTVWRMYYGTIKESNVKSIPIESGSFSHGVVGAPSQEVNSSHITKLLTVSPKLHDLSPRRKKPQVTKVFILILNQFEPMFHKSSPI